jgi:hypothetical protein
LSQAQRNGKKDLVIFLDFLGNLNLGLDAVVQSPADLAEIRNVGQAKRPCAARRSEVVSNCAAGFRNELVASAFA